MLDGHTTQLRVAGECQSGVPKAELQEDLLGAQTVVLEEWALLCATTEHARHEKL